MTKKRVAAGCHDSALDSLDSCGISLLARAATSADRTPDGTHGMLGRRGGMSQLMYKGPSSVGLDYRAKLTVFMHEPKANNAARGISG
ncbi:hypothetical protein Adu01nite_33670 [Paractinoplanes durhamensis]|uniref:Uncharacterized protein n=1 Tax=Paractinoplanes durhamensis TaxID=113563 RepID=A0ABQ3YWU0_9ACTN|nr:hypothetical protein Adu01nite_33670 [Actinoplanes durhamensis]